MAINRSEQRSFRDLRSLRPPFKRTYRTGHVVATARDADDPARAFLVGLAPADRDDDTLVLESDVGYYPAVRTIWQGIRRTHGVAPVKKAALSVADLCALIGTLPNTLLGDRDRAILLVGFAGGFRRSELVALDVRITPLKNWAFDGGPPSPEVTSRVSRFGQGRGQHRAGGAVSYLEKI